MIASLLVTVALLLGVWLAYLMGRRAAPRGKDPLGGNPHAPPCRMPTHPTADDRPLPYAPPDPPWVTQRQLGGTARPRALKERVRVCGGCGSELSPRPPQPPRTP